jgi:polysaccharide export outer membrane protein
MTVFKDIGPLLVLLTIAAPGMASAQPATVPAPALATPPVVPQGAPARTPGGPPSAAPREEYIIGPEDVVEVEVVGQADRTRARVYADGTIQVNLAGQVAAAGKTPRQLGSDVAAALKTGGFYANPVVNVEVVGFSSRYVTVLGAVGSPGLVPINRPYRLSEILARVGGVREGAADYLVVRPQTGPEKRYMVEKLASGASEEDPMVAPGDKIFSPAAEIFYITGQVKSPGTYPVRTDLTIAQAIARGGGLTDSGTDKKVKVTRAGKVMKLGPTEKVMPGDVLDIAERLF